MWAGSVEVGEVRSASAGVSGGSRGSESAPWSPLVLPGRSGASSDAGGRRWDFLGALVLPEVGEVMYCSLVQAEVAGRLLEVG